MIKIGMVVPVLNNFDQFTDLVYSARTKNELKIYVQPQYRYQVPLAKAWNNGFNQAVNDGCSYVLICNDDVLLAPHSIDDAIHFMNGIADIDLLGFQVVAATFDDPFEITFALPDQVYTPRPHERDPVYTKDLASCFMVRANFFEEFGSFDENFDPAWWEDTDMLYRIHLLGGKVFESPVPFIHLRHQTTQKLNAPLNSMKSGEYYMKKWGSAKKDLKELYKTPYNDPTLTPKDWKRL